MGVKLVMEDVWGEGGDGGCVGVRVVREWKLMRLCAWELMVFVS